MSEGKHTPGPWVAVHRPDHYSGNPDLYEIHWTDDGECVAEIVHGGNDARLIAAAPDMLAALGALLKRYTSLVECGDCGNWNPEDEEEVIAARDAIRKARGGSDA